MSHAPGHPTQPKDPLLVARPRPDSITLACTFMVAGAFLGILDAVLVIAAMGAAARDFRSRAGLTGATPQQIDAVATGLATWSMAAGVTELVLSLVMVVLAVRVWRGSQPARLLSLLVLSASIVCSLAWSAFTVRGGTNLQPDGMDEQTGRGISNALGLSTSGLPTYVGGGLTCLKVLGYIAVLGLLLWPAANPYFRRSRTT